MTPTEYRVKVFKQNIRTFRQLLTRYNQERAAGRYYRIRVTALERWEHACVGAARMAWREALDSTGMREATDNQQGNAPWGYIVRVENKHGDFWLSQRVYRRYDAALVVKHNVSDSGDHDRVYIRPATQRQFHDALSRVS